MKTWGKAIPRTPDYVWFRVLTEEESVPVPNENVPGGTRMEWFKPGDVEIVDPKNGRYMLDQWGFKQLWKRVDNPDEG
jgi:hypothetical protein